MTGDTRDGGPEAKMPSEAVSKILAQSSAHAVRAAIKSAGEGTGVSFDLLYNMARRESALDPAAKAKTSSAAGLFQFIEQTWLGAVKAYGVRHGLAAEAAAISQSDGKFSVGDPATRKAILDLRLAPDKAAALAGELVRENQKHLETALGRAATPAEIYAAHFLGPAGAAKLLSADPAGSAAALLPKAAAANRPVFYDGIRERSVAEVLASFDRSMSAPVPDPEFPRDLQTKSAAAPDAPASPTLWPLAAIARATGSPERLRPGETAAAQTAAERMFTRLFTLREEENRPTLAPLAIAVLQALDPAVIGKSGRRGLRN